LASLQYDMAKRHEEEESEALIIDEPALAEMPPDDEIRQWARSQRVFISSVMEELVAERTALAGTIRALGAEPVWFEEFGGRDDDPHQAYLSEVASSHVYIGILARRYGRPLPTRFSATHTEYRHAEEKGLRIAVWVSDASDREGHEQSFVDDVRTFHVAPTYRSVDDLKRQVDMRLRRIASEELTPWCKLGSTVFRARRIIHRRDEIRVEAVVRSDEVAHALDGMQPDKWGHGPDMQFTGAGKSLFVRITDVEITTTASRTRTFVLTLSPQEPHRDSLLDVTMGDYGPDDQTEFGLRSALFGERNPISDQGFGVATNVPNPFRPLLKQRVAEEVIRPIGQVLITEALVGSGRAERVVHFRLGPPVAGRRRAELQWQPPRRYSNNRSGLRKIEGVVQLS